MRSDASRCMTRTGSPRPRPRRASPSRTRAGASPPRWSAWARTRRPAPSSPTLSARSSSGPRRPSASGPKR
eukprot:7846556-Alexandrium_andersonii.AAC.1